MSAPMLAAALLQLQILLAVPTAPVASPPGGARLPLPVVVQRMQRNYDGMKGFTARYTQKLTGAALGRTKVSTGKLAFRKPGQMRWDYDAPEPQMFLFTGALGWWYQPAEKQAFRQDARQTQLPAALAFIMGKGKLSDEFEIAGAAAKHGRPEDYELALKPKQAQSTYKSIVFVVDPRTFFVTQTVLTDAAGTVNHFAFTDLRVDAKIPDATFKWTPPPGTKEISIGGAK